MSPDAASISPSFRMSSRSEPPEDIESYIHRAGRTGRAGSTGTAVMLVRMMDRPAVARIAKQYEIEMREVPLPTDEDVESVVTERLTTLLEARLRDRDSFRPSAAVDSYRWRAAWPKTKTSPPSWPCCWTTTTSKCCMHPLSGWQKQSRPNPSNSQTNHVPVVMAVPAAIAIGTVDVAANADKLGIETRTSNSCESPTSFFVRLS